MGEVQTLIKDQINDFLMAPATESEVLTTLFMMHQEKAPCLDGMTALFFQKALDTIKTGLLFLINSFLKDGVFDKQLDTTNLFILCT